MKTYPRACSLLFAAAAAAVLLVVPRPSDAFKSPGFLTASANQTRVLPRAMNTHFDEVDSSVYLGPVFVIKEASTDGDEATYDAFVLNGGIEEVKQPVSSTRAATRANGTKKPSTASNNGTATTPGGVKKKPSAAAGNNGTVTASSDGSKKKPSAAASNNGTVTASSDGSKKKPSAAASNNGTLTALGADGKKKPSAASSNNGTTSADPKKTSNATSGKNDTTVTDPKMPSTVASNNDTVAQEDPDFFGVLITHDSATHIKLPGSLRVNVSLSVLLRVAASKMPWLLVMRRNSTMQMSVYHATTTAPQEEGTQRRKRQAFDGTATTEDVFGSGNGNGNDSGKGNGNGNDSGKGNGNGNDSRKSNGNRGDNNGSIPDRKSRRQKYLRVTKFEAKGEEDFSRRFVYETV